MIALTLPDGAVREFDGPVSGFDVAKSISSSLAKKSFAIIVNGEVRDLSREIDTDATITGSRVQSRNRNRFQWTGRW